MFLDLIRFVSSRREGGEARFGKMDGIRSGSGGGGRCVWISVSLSLCLSLLSLFVYERELPVRSVWTRCWGEGGKRATVRSWIGVGFGARKEVGSLDVEYVCGVRRSRRYGIGTGV